MPEDPADRTKFVLSPEAWDEFNAMLDTVHDRNAPMPDAASPRLVELFSRPQPEAAWEALKAHVVTIIKPPLYDDEGKMNPNYRMECSCGKVSNIASTDPKFAKKIADEHIAAQINPTLDPFDGL